MAISPIEFYGKFSPRPVDTSTAERMRALAGLGRATQKLAVDYARTKRQEEAEAAEAEAIQAAEAEAVKTAEAARTVDEKTGEVTYAPVEKRGASELGAAQYNLALQNALNSQRDQDSRQQILDLATEHQDDPNAFLADATAYMNGVLKASPIEDQPALRNTISKRIQSAYSPLLRNYDNATQKKAIGIHSNNINSGFESLDRLVTLNEDYSVEYQSILESMKARADIDETYDYEASVAALDKSIAKSELSRDILNIADTNVSDAYKELLASEKKIPENFSGQEWSETLDAIRIDLNAKAANIKNAKLVDEQAEREFAQGVISSVAMNMEVSDSDIARARKALEGTDGAKNLDDALAVQEYVGVDYSSRSKLRADAENMGIAGAELLEKMNTAERNINKALAQDALGFAFAQKGSGIERSDFNVLAPTAESLEIRKRNAKLASQHYTDGQMNFPILTGQEADLFIRGFSIMSPEEQAAISRVYGADSNIWGLLSDKNQGVYAQAGSHPDASVSSGIFDGLEAIKTNQVKVSGQDFKSTFATHFYDYLGEGTVPHQDAKDLLDASIAFYASTVPQGQEQIDTEKASDAIKSVIGEMTDYNGFKTLLPVGIDEDEFEDYWDSVTTAELSRLMPFAPDTYIDTVYDYFQSGDVRLEQVAGGQYIARLGGAMGIVQPDGTPVYFSINPETISVSRELRRQEAATKQARKAESLAKFKEYQETKFPRAL